MKPLGFALRVFVVLVPLTSADAIEPASAAERLRADRRASVELLPARIVRTATRSNREKLLQKFSDLAIWEKREVSLSLLLSSEPADPEEICKWLVRYGQDMFLAGKSYGVFSETIHAIGVA